MLIGFLFPLPCPVTIITFFLPRAYLPPDVQTLLPACEVAAEPTTVPIAFEDYAAVLTTDPVVIAYPFIVFAWHHS